MPTYFLETTDVGTVVKDEFGVTWLVAARPLVGQLWPPAVEGLTGLTGPAGPTGATGATGPVGATGPSGAATRVTSLPGAPTDGQEIVYVADATNGVLWHLKYNAGSASAYKWEFVGGSPLAHSPTSVLSPTNTAYGDAADASGPTLTLPLAGDYEIAHGAAFYVAATPNNFALQAVKIGAAAAADAEAVQYFKPTTSAADGQSITAEITLRRTGLAAATVLKCQYRVGLTSGAIFIDHRALRATPIRVG